MTKFPIQIYQMSKNALSIFRYALCVCRNIQGKYLCVKENMNKGWWIPGGKVKIGETFRNAAIRQCKQETGIDANIKGIIRLDSGKFYDQDIIRCIYYMEMRDDLQVPKIQQDAESQMAKFLSLSEIEGLRSQWRSQQIYQFPKYLQEGGEIFPQNIFVQNFNRVG